MLGFIGVGGMGTGLINTFKEFPEVEIAAVCDVYEPHLRRAQSAAGGTPETYGDFRRVLDRKDIDAVVIATPDHWHGIPTILACQAGKDVYCEKPLAHRIQEGRAMVQAAEKYKRVTQMGNLIHAGENYHRVVEIVRSGVLGKISQTRVWMAADRSGLGRPADGSPPAGCDYDFWLGPAPARPFNPNRFTFNWRYFWDYGGGILTDFCCHIVDLVHWAMDVDAPRTISAVGGRYALDDNARSARYPRRHLRIPKGGPEVLDGLEPDRRQHARARKQGAGHHVSGDRRHARGRLRHVPDHPRKGPKDRRAAQDPAPIGRPSSRVARRDQDRAPSARAISATATAWRASATWATSRSGPAKSSRGTRSPSGSSTTPKPTST